MDLLKNCRTLDFRKDRSPPITIQILLPELHVSTDTEEGREWEPFPDSLVGMMGMHPYDPRAGS